MTIPKFGLSKAWTLLGEENNVDIATVVTNNIIKLSKGSFCQEIFLVTNNLIVEIAKRAKQTKSQ